MIREAKTENGWVRGAWAADPRITAFKGIPFAAPPVGKNRWRAPQPCESWEGVRDAVQFAPISVQDTPGLGSDIYCREWHVDPEIPMDEDCLYLNIWTGAKHADDKQPVLVWFYGGGLQWGYPAEMEFDGERLARRGIVVVTVNYRINVFGFLAHPQLSMEQPDAPTNFGSLDQQAGLKWVVRNIAAFGGDPGNITIAGQSAGGGSVLSQMTCPTNYGLFQKAVIMSAMIRNPYEEGGMGVPQPLWKAEINGMNFFKFLGVASVEEARELDAFYIRDCYAKFREQNPMMMTVLDYCFCCGDPLVLFAEGKHAPVPVMAGNTSDEFPNFISASSKEELKCKAEALYGERAEEFLKFPEAAHSDGNGNYAKVSGIECTVKELFMQNSRNGLEQPCYYYRFDGDIPGWDQPGTFHSVDLWFFFETLAKCWRPFTGRHYDLARQMCSYWANFIKSGDPNGPDVDGTPMPAWLPYTQETPCEMIFSKEGAVVNTDAESPFKLFLMEDIHKRLLWEQEEQQNWMHPVWEGESIWRETFAMISENGSCKAPFLFEPQQIIKVESYDGKQEYEQGCDFTVEKGMLVLTPGSRIRHTDAEVFFYPTIQEAKTALEEAAVDLGFGPVATTEGNYVNLSAVGNPEVVTKWQLAVTYTTKEKWKGLIPESSQKELPGLCEKLKRKEEIRIVLYGDSISCGFDCSGKYGQKPGQPVWPDLLKRCMDEKWESPVRFWNRSVSGVDTEWAIQNAKQRVCAYEPDLVILGFGMNDRCHKAEYAEKTQRLIDTIRKKCPQTEFVLIATTLPNPLLYTPPMYFCAYQDEYEDALKALCGPGVVLANVQAVQKEIMKKKRYLDLTGNLLNHPNDYLSRIQAQVLAAVLGLCSPAN